MNVRELQKILSKLDQNLKIFVRQEPDNTGDVEINYYTLRKEDIKVDYVVDYETGDEPEALLIGDDRCD